MPDFKMKPDQHPGYDAPLSEEALGQGAVAPEAEPQNGPVPQDKPVLDVPQNEEQAEPPESEDDETQEEIEDAAPAKSVLYYSDYQEATSDIDPSWSALDDGTEERYLVMRDYCLRAKGVECDRCQRACPMGAITFRENGLPRIDDSACTRCGICAGICDGFSSNNITLEDMRERILRAASVDNQVFLTCHENIFDDFEPAENVVVLPCLAALPPQLYALLLAEDIQVTLACDLSFCEDCFRAPNHGSAFYTAAVQTAEAWTGKQVGFADAVPEKQPIFQDVVHEENSRRELFTGLLGNANKVASGEYSARTDDVLKEFFAMQERMRASIAEDLDETLDINSLFSGGRANKVLFPRHELLLSIPKVSPDLAPRIPAVISRTDAQRCCQSLECTRACPTSARYADEYGNLLYDAAFCIGCGICATTCQQGACSLANITLDQLPDLAKLGERTAADLPEPVSAQYEPVRNILQDAEDQA